MAEPPGPVKAGSTCPAGAGVLEKAGISGEGPMPADQTCQTHPQEPVAALCQKYGRGLCADCLENRPVCPDPDIFCTHRPQCLIHFQQKERRRRLRQGAKP